jgi:hypothetical protein
MSTPRQCPLTILVDTAIEDDRVYITIDDSDIEHNTKHKLGDTSVNIENSDRNSDNGVSSNKASKRQQDSIDDEQNFSTTADPWQNTNLTNDNSPTERSENNVGDKLNDDDSMGDGDSTLDDEVDASQEVRFPRSGSNATMMP